MVVNLRQRNTLQFQYFWDFNKCLRAIFSQFSFENFWLYFLGEVPVTQKLSRMTQKYFKSPFSESPWINSLSWIATRSRRPLLTSVSSESSKIHILIFNISRLTFADSFLFHHAQNVTLYYIQSSATWSCLKS